MLRPVNIVWGTDPEGFFKRDGIIIGSERVIPEHGLRVPSYMPNVVRDGIQFELNPAAAKDVRLLGANVGQAFRLLKTQVGQIPGVSVCFDGLVEVNRAELDALSEKSRILGCMPSKNVYGDKPITVDPKTYRKRSAGGHEHFGLYGTKVFDPRSVEDERHRQVPYLDVFVANTCVMLDRDPGAAERRENYGRAGEYRFPPHGLEYRTLSNFWLRGYPLMSLAFGLAHMAIATLEGVLYGESFEDELNDVVNIDRVVEAIDTNNWHLARTNFDALIPFIVKHVPQAGTFPLGADNIHKFITFAEGVRDNGLPAYFPQDPIEHWVEGKFSDFNVFLETL